MTLTKFGLQDAGYEYVGDNWPAVAASSINPPSVGWYSMMAEQLDQASPWSEVWYHPGRQNWFIFTPQFPCLE